VIEAFEAAAEAAGESGMPRSLLSLEATCARLLQTVGERSADALPKLRLSDAAEVSRVKFARDISRGETDWISSIVPSEYTLVGKMERGTHGAWLIKSEDETPLIFKRVDSNDVTPQISASARMARAADSPLSPTPRYLGIGYKPGKGSWYVQEFLPGLPAPAPSDKLIAQMVRMNMHQADAATGDATDWSSRVMSALYQDSKGWQERIGNSGEDGRALVGDIRKLIERNSNIDLRGGDVVHGDFQHYNALVDQTDRMTGYVDWEGAGKGDRGIDLTRLLYDAHVSEAEKGFQSNPATLAWLNQHAADVSGKAARDNFMSYWVMQVADFGLKKSPQEARLFVGVGRGIIDALSSENALRAASSSPLVQVMSE
jgi:hypothetical protein